MVVNDIEQDADAARMCRIDEPPQVVGATVQMRWRKEVDTVVTPSKATFELRNGHQFDHRDTHTRELVELTLRTGPGPFTRERARVQLVDHLSFERHARPARIAPII